ncbi:hypothetical protein SRB5_56310 [Streptomyces sp. RB5]|uniref:Maltokinase N-terminal cap domain-containing protein n=1 Tax=Streptomyces smaragdinus TaxID=2585196 RepID=A0A7K0CPS6_9ACTN|nr:1,4-alpha-glucan branching protein [Streptomyces smaragdinus]MQY15449.1 hypothetical protein [Streptomyces smaragdinus]
MAHIHHTTMSPTKLELLAAWLPKQDWYAGDPADLRRSGGFRLDDPEGEVGIEFMVVGSGEDAYLVPMTYRAAPLEGAEAGLIGTSEHGVLGSRWIYDGVYDPTLVATLFAFLRGEVQAQAQSVSDTLDPTVTGSLPHGDAPVTIDAVLGGTDVRLLPEPRTLHVNRRLAEGPAPDGVRGHLEANWTRADGEQVRGIFATVR